MKAEPHIDVERVLSQLKDFQRQTVEHAFGRLYLDPKPTNRFLVADEVGLGKTMVARGLLAKVIHHLRNETAVDRIDVVYVCSNAAIARQNIRRLNILGDADLEASTRLTMLPERLKDLQKNRINFVSFTPSTTFDLRSRCGIAEERRLLFHMLLRRYTSLSKSGLRNMLRGPKGIENWRRMLAYEPAVDPELEKSFAASFRQRGLLVPLREISDSCRGLRRGLPADLKASAYGLVGELRHALAEACVNALEPDLVILDEFQRFRDLLDGDSDAAALARSLFSFRDQAASHDVRIILLSATPYRMFTLDHEVDDDHYADFRRTMGFLLDDPSEQAALEEDLHRFRRALHHPREVSPEVEACRAAIERRLRSVMVRTERTAVTLGGDGMLEDRPLLCPAETTDLSQARVLGHVARAVGSRDPIEHWKSAPYLLSFMQDYQLKARLEASAKSPSDSLQVNLAAPEIRRIRRGSFHRYQEIDPANGRLRALMADTIGAGQTRLLWMPASLPYLTPGGVFQDVAGTTKALVFSSWTVVPNAIAALCSYEAERLVLGHHRNAGTRLDRPLDYSMRDGEPASMSTLTLMYPCLSLAQAVDPLALAMSEGLEGAGRPPGDGNIDGVRAAARRIVADRLRPVLNRHETSGSTDLSWYWAAPVLLDSVHTPAACEWLNGHQWPSRMQDSDEAGRGFMAHLEQLRAMAAGGLSLGRAPDDLLDVLVDLTLGAPGICAVRSLGRLSEGAPSDRQGPAVRIAEGFRSLFNHRESVGIVRAQGRGGAYWRAAAAYAVDGNLQAVLDEYLHLLVEAEGLIENVSSKLDVLAEAAHEALTIRTTQVKVDEIRVRRGRVDITPFRIRSSFALRFGELRDEREQVLARIDTVRQAFNSPFRPFILASTSIGQEGLDFHRYCHAVYHWNLPSNPVDLEQREGRVHRYKGHAVRKNVAHRYGLRHLAASGWNGGDPWTALFEAARHDRPAGTSDLVPYWVYEDGPARVERRVPMLHFSREEARLEKLKRSLALYRLVFGQPRQQDLLAHIEQVSRGLADENLSALRIELGPAEGAA